MAVPVPKACWPIVVTAANGKIDLRRSGAGADDTATIAAGTYLSAALLAVAVQGALAAAYGTGVWTVTVSATGRFTIAHSATAFALKFSTGANAATSARDLLGFGSVDTASALSATATSQHQGGWYADDPVADDTGDLPGYERAVARAQGGQTRAVDFGTTYDRVVTLEHLEGHKVFKADEGAGHLNEAIERLFDSGWSRFRWWPDASVEGTWTDYVLAPDTAKALTRARLSPGHPRYALTLRLWKWVG